MNAPVDYSPDPTLTPQQHRIITLLAAGNSITQAAAAEDIHRNTVGYWRRTIPAFARELEFALREQRLHWHEQATALVPQAIQAIEDSLINPDASPALRLRAAALVLKMATDPQSKALKAFPTLPPELEAMSGQVLSWRKDMSDSNPAAENFPMRQAAEIAVAAQNCTKAIQPPVRVAPQPGRNSLCPCGSGVKFKRCCAHPANVPAAQAA